MKIVLMGYMASGKSAIGKLLAKRLKIEFIDLDKFIETKENLNVSEIFLQKGEIYFRKKETQYLNEILDLEIDFVLSLGGGTPCYGNNIDIIRLKSISFYLKASIATIFKRIQNETTTRPLVAQIGKENLEEYIAKHLFERASFYQKAKHTILVDSKIKKAIVNEIYSLI